MNQGGPAMNPANAISTMEIENTPECAASPRAERKGGGNEDANRVLAAAAASAQTLIRLPRLIAAGAPPHPK
jgi:hypothetical protein